MKSGTDRRNALQKADRNETEKREKSNFQQETRTSTFKISNYLSVHILD